MTEIVCYLAQHLHCKLKMYCNHNADPNVSRNLRDTISQEHSEEFLFSDLQINVIRGNLTSSQESVFDAQPIVIIPRRDAILFLSHTFHRTTNFSCQYLSGNRQT
ncbi:hypothetical protein VCUG_02151 [Vavraia culicis subsp. floridensis]|uniref:Uncharacterized protein n=1 Tax=Vavraia culicis (isolate floridensis) TaxID=948595 RepID=L2GRS0_VAVCU|nr:uncharacterized protein VCUG_02151 [Vavraia culicis subsp. floridensis]ELA46346.1 hypothetical protein VCUG_02151 [Vavraia culicis subsp. floridensis]